MTLHGALSIILTIKPGMKGPLMKLLEEIDADVNLNQQIPFSRIGSIHFARFVILDARPDTEDCLVFTSNYDQPFEEHLRQLVEHGGRGFWKLFSHCVEFPEGEFDPSTLTQFFRSKNKIAETFYVGAGNRSVTQVRQENELRTAIENFLDQHHDQLKNKSGTEIRDAIKQFVFNNPELAWAKDPEPPFSASYQFSHYAKLILVLLLVLVLLPLILAFVIGWLLIFLLVEISEKDIRPVVTKEHIRELLDREKGVVQNQFTAYGKIKPGKMRYLTMMFLLKLTNFLAPYLFAKGRLSGIPTVHFARWLILSEGKQMLFLSNYDGNSEGYLRDFINIAGKQLTLMFAHTEGYPKTRLMVLGGAKDAKGFMAWARSKQIITNVWYSAHPDVSVKNIYQNSAIRAGLYGEMNSRKTREWLQLL